MLAYPIGLEKQAAAPVWSRETEKGQAVPDDIRHPGPIVTISPERVAVITFNEIPASNPTFKYDILGQMAIENRRRYCARHGYHFIHDVPIARDRPACWAKIPAMLAAFETHEWVLWVDSDVLAASMDRGIEPYLNPACDLITQKHDRYHELLGIPAAEGTRRMPINTGVFLMRATAWSRDFLSRAYDETAFVTHGPVWDGIGEQEAMIALLHRAPQDLRRIGYVDLLQAPPRFYQPGCLFLHFYGNRAMHIVPPSICDEVLARWDRAVRNGDDLPADLARFHWCCIQNKETADPAAGGGPGRYLYRLTDIATP